ncbi:MAG: hypothetical protein R2724_22645 [Bryobacterales bacterium]
MALTVGLGTGYKFRDPIRDAVDPILFGTPEAKESSGPTPKQVFEVEAIRVTELHRRQTKQTILALKAKYESLYSGVSGFGICWKSSRFALTPPIPRSVA